jgi:hypothetical protein
MDFKFILKQENNVDDSLKETSRRSFPSSQTQSRIEPFAMANFFRETTLKFGEG